MGFHISSVAKKTPCRGNLKKMLLGGHLMAENLTDDFLISTVDVKIPKRVESH